VLRPITFDEEIAQGRDDIVYIHLGHALLQRSARILREALFNVDSPVHRVTAVVAEGLPQSCVAAVSRLVLVGLGRLRLHEQVIGTLYKRRDSDIARAREIFAAFRVNLQESRDRLDREIRSEEEKLFPDDQQRQRQHDLAGMIDRLASLDDEERREVNAVSARYAGIKHHVTAAAVVFALTPDDAAAVRNQA